MLKYGGIPSGKITFSAAANVKVKQQITELYDLVEFYK